MRIESKLCHITEGKAVVQVKGWINEKNQGSALGEGATVEDAEDKAIWEALWNVAPPAKGTGTASKGYFKYHRELRKKLYLETCKYMRLTQRFSFV